MAAPAGHWVLSRRASRSRLGRLASLLVVLLPSAMRRVVSVLAWLLRLASWWLGKVGLGGAVMGMTRSMLLFAVERAEAWWWKWEAVVP